MAGIIENIKQLTLDVLGLFYPPSCAVCSRAIPREAGFMCVECRNDIPLTGYWETADNPVRERFAGHVVVERASAFFHFVPGSPFRDLIHRFKYLGGWKAAREIGLWYGSTLAESGNYDDIDLVVPVPLHRRKLYKRGYNQSQYLAEGIARALGAELSTGNLVRTRHGKSQTKVEGSRRWDNVAGAFAVRRPDRLEGRHILLVDDVLTTGATLIACAEQIQKAAPGCRISIAALAATRTQ